MIRKLRIKLVIASLLSLLLVLFVLFCAVGILNYRKTVTDADSILAILQENDGSFPIKDHADDGIPADEPPRNAPVFSAELPYESRYFSIFLTSSGDVISVNTGKIAAVDTTTAIEYAQSVVQDGRTQGFVEDYRYTV